jgi:hypothetical protein
MKHTARLALVAALVSISAKAAPFMAVGDGAELFVTSSLQVQFDDNIYLDTKNEVDDTILSFTPGVDLVFGKGSATTGNLYYKEEIKRFSDNDQQNDELSSFGINSSTTSGNSKFDFNASYAQLAQNDNDIRATGTLVHRKVGNLGAKAEFDLTGKTKLGVGVTYADTNYGPASYTDAKIWSLPVDVYYEATEKLDWSFGYRYRNTEQSGTAKDFKDHFLSIGGRGEFSPKLTGQVRVGYNKREFSSGLGDDSGLGLDGNLTYAATDKTSLSFNMSNDYGNSGTGDFTEIFRWGVSANSKLTEQWALQASLNYSATKYSTRDDDFLDGLVALNYSYNQYFSFTASMALRDNSSSSAAAEFKQTVFSFAGNIRY